MEEWHIPSEQEQCSQDFLMLIAQLANTSKQQIVGVRRPRYEANLSCCNHWIGLRTKSLEWTSGMNLIFSFLCVLKADGLMSVHKRRCPCSVLSTNYQP